MRLTKGSNRNTNCHILYIRNYVNIYFSYETAIGYRGPRGMFRLENVWGPTTGRHMKEMGIYDFSIVEPSELSDIINNELKLFTD